MVCYANILGLEKAFSYPIQIQLTAYLPYLFGLDALR